MSQTSEESIESNQDEVSAAIQAIAQSTVRPRRSPILRTPADYGMAYEDIFFPSVDGVPLEGWVIPADSDRLIVFNHPGTMNRYGYPGHLEPWKLFNDTEVNFHRIYAALHRAGYNILTYDMRNHGASGEANGGVCGMGLYEWRDVIGAMQYVQNHEKLKDMTVGLYGQCAGANAAFIAMTKQPEFFEGVKAFVCPQPVSLDIGMREIISLQGLGEHMNTLDEEMRKQGGFATGEMSPHPYAPNVKVPTFIIQVRDDVWSRPVDVQTTFDLIPGEEKKLFWIEGTAQRFDGYNYFGEHPEQMIEFYDTYMRRNGAC